MKELNFSEQYSIKDISAWMDGGTVTIDCIDSNQVGFQIEFFQHLSLGIKVGGRFPGRIYLDDQIVEPRSALESQILSSLNNAKIEIDYLSKDQRGRDKSLISEKIEYVKSDTFIRNNKITQIHKDVLLGKEFDWFAVDTNNELAVFRTSGIGSIPPSVILDYKSHLRILENIGISNIETLEAGSFFAEQGLYIYDCNQSNEPYKRSNRPQQIISDELQQTITQIESLIKVPFNFKEKEEAFI